MEVNTLVENNDRCSSTIEIHHGTQPQLQLSAASEGIRGALCKNEGGNEQRRKAGRVCNSVYYAAEEFAWELGLTD